MVPFISFSECVQRNKTRRQELHTTSLPVSEMFQPTEKPKNPDIDPIVEYNRFMQLRKQGIFI